MLKLAAANEDAVGASVRKTIAIALAALREVETEIAEGELGSALDQAVQLILGLKGRVMISGIGKSGHIGRKIAATLASTGTPAYFVHPTEASHGDLGMITRDDALLAISWSGETTEFASLLAYAERFAVPMIALTSGRNSTLGKAASVALVLPKVTEACPHGLAPTTSTLIQMAIGDAIAMALLEARSFGAQDFKVFHPGGQLGAQLRQVQEVMHREPNLPLCAVGAGMGEAILTITEKGFGTVGVIDQEGRLAGIITDGDIRRHIGNGLMEKRVEEVMTKTPRTISPEAMLAKAMQTMEGQKINVLFAVEEGRPVGIVHMLDLLRAGVA
ncbi:SIS domain-containing protein [Afifella sp. IM 167]|uniref:KpsF/GutQ family sugar-phosphate isomerase n=1 Tax=Afifella sp. IM 167 TaxID=2033586 RepID=UPI001CCE2083|nr:KpsF/GutQ family sugar-phosphate isomerase [Afifella sp. IM 167]MBZ8131687.1 KpsF/GutQ family sugar-phosphate isomerase [Afifella sp. IM 167]